MLVAGTLQTPIYPGSYFMTIIWSSIYLVAYINCSGTTARREVSAFKDEPWGVLVFLNFSEHQILSSLCSLVFHTFTLQLPIQTLHSVAPELQVFASSLENCQNFSKTSTPLLCL